MNTLQLFSKGLASIPTMTAWCLSDLAQSFGKQELYTRQTPQRLQVLREHALIESAVSSNRIEGVVADQSRIATLVFGKSLLRDRSEEEIRGYRDALKWIHEQGSHIPISEDTIKELHRLSRGEIWDAGKYKKKDGDIIEKYPDGRERVRFKTVSAQQTEASMKQLLALWRECVKEKWVPLPIAVAAFNLDFLCIHPFRDGNGRASRLLLLLQCYELGYEMGRYISLERIIEENKDRYYETLEQSSQGWHQGEHDPWPYISFILFVLKTAYREFEERVGLIKDPRGAKTGLVEAAVRNTSAPFSLIELERLCPGVSRDMIRRILRQMQAAHDVECLGRGPAAKWQFKGNKGNNSKRGQ